MSEEEISKELGLHLIKQVSNKKKTVKINSMENSPDVDKYNY